MNILLFIPDKDKSVGGIFQYIHCLITLVAKEDKQNTYYLFLRNNTSYFIEYAQKYNHIICIPEEESGNKSTLYTLKEKIIKGILFTLKKMKITIDIKTPSSLDKIIEKYKIDIVHFPYQRFEKTKVPGIITMHDVQELYFPQYFSSEIRANRAVNYKYAIDEAAKVVVSYQHIKNDIVHFFDKPENQVAVLLLNMENLWYERYQDNTQHHKSVKDLPAKFLLCPAVTWEHKNHLNLLQSLVYLRDTKKIVVNVVCTGKQTDYYTDILTPFIQKNKLQTQVVFLGMVEDEILYSLYKSCTGTVVPTKYEAGSFPLMESLLLNIPVVCSNVTSLPETIGNDYYTFDPNDYVAMAEKIELLYTSEEFRKKNIQNAVIQSKRLQNTDAFNKLMRIYQSTVNTDVMQ